MKSRSVGFTLLEVLFALVLLGLLLTMLGSALVAGNRAMARGERYAQGLDELRSAQNFIRQAVQQALPLGMRRVSREPAVVFDGQAQYLRFSAVLPQALGGGVQVHTFDLVQLPDGQALRVAFADPLLRPWGQPQVLLRGVRELRLAYQGLNPEGQASEWLTPWPWPARLPQKVRVQVQVQGPIGWVSQTVALRLDLGATQAAP